MTVSLRGPVTGSKLSYHDALYAFPANMQHNGTLISGSAADTGCPRITLADAATQRVKFMWEVPVDNDALAIRWAWTNESASSGNVKFQFAYKLIYIGEGNVDGAVTTITVPAIAAAGQFDFNYSLPTETASIATPDVFGKPFLLGSLSRLGADATDTLAAGISIIAVTATRVDLP